MLTNQWSKTTTVAMSFCSHRSLLEEILWNQCHVVTREGNLCWSNDLVDLLVKNIQYFEYILLFSTQSRTFTIRCIKGTWGVRWGGHACSIRLATKDGCPKEDTKIHACTRKSLDNKEQRLFLYTSLCCFGPHKLYASHLTPASHSSSFCECSCISLTKLKLMKLIIKKPQYPPFVWTYLSSISKCMK